MKFYLATGLACFAIGAVMPEAWLLRQPNAFESAQLVGVVLVIAAGYLSLLRMQQGRFVALAGYAAVASFMIHTAYVATRQRGLVLGLASVGLAVCVAGAVFAFRSSQVPEQPQEPGRGRSRAWGLGWPALIVLVVLACFWPWRGRRDPNRYLVPDGYVGWVVIDYGVRGAAPVPLREGALELAIPATGRLQTSSKPEYGFAADEWELVNAVGTRTPIEGSDTPGGRIWRWSAGTLEQPGGSERHTEQFFVGTEAQLATMEKTYPEGP